MATTATFLTLNGTVAGAGVRRVELNSLIVSVASSRSFFNEVAVGGMLLCFRKHLYLGEGGGDLCFALHWSPTLAGCCSTRHADAINEDDDDVVEASVGVRRLPLSLMVVTGTLVLYCFLLVHCVAFGSNVQINSRSNDNHQDGAGRCGELA